MRARTCLVGLLVPLAVGILIVTSPASGATVHLGAQFLNGPLVDSFFDVFVDLADPNAPAPPEPVNLNDPTHPSFSLTLGSVESTARFFFGVRQTDPSDVFHDVTLTVDTTDPLVQKATLTDESGLSFYVFFDASFFNSAGDSLAPSITDPGIIPADFPTGSLALDFTVPLEWRSHEPPFTMFTIGTQFKTPIEEEAAVFGTTIPEPSALIRICSLVGALGITVGWWRRRKAA